MFEANSVSDLTAEEYKVLVLAEVERIEAEKKVHEEMKRRQKLSRRGSHGAEGRTVSIRTRP